MIEIEFQDLDTGGLTVLVMDRDEAPSIGEVIERGGMRLKRLMPTLQRPIVSKGVRHKAFSLPPWTPGADHYDENGTPCVSSQAEVDRIRKASDGHLDYGEHKV